MPGSKRPGARTRACRQCCNALHVAAHSQRPHLRLKHGPDDLQRPFGCCDVQRGRPHWPGCIAGPLPDLQPALWQLSRRHLCCTGVFRHAEQNPNALHDSTVAASSLNGSAGHVAPSPGLQKIYRVPLLIRSRVAATMLNSSITQAVPANLLPSSQSGCLFAQPTALTSVQSLATPPCCHQTVCNMDNNFLVCKLLPPEHCRTLRTAAAL